MKPMGGLAGPKVAAGSATVDRVTSPPPPHIGTLNEGSLHAALKERYREPGDQLEVKLNGFVIDIKRGDHLIEVQTGSFGAMGRKLDRLLGDHTMLLVYPIATESYLVRDGKNRRKSPKKLDVYALFDELVSLPTMLDHPNLAIEVVLVRVEKHQVHDPGLRRRRGGWRTVDRRLLEITDVHRFDSMHDLMRLLPSDLPETFTTADIATGARIRRDQAQKIAYCCRHAGVFSVVDKHRNGLVYRWNRPA